MEVDPTPAFVTTVPPDRTIHLPQDVPIGATVAVVLLPRSGDSADEALRRQRFERTREALRVASERPAGAPELDDATLNALIDEARRS